MEQVVFADDLSVELDTPDCKFGYPGCYKKADSLYQAHGCASHFCCKNCRELIQLRFRVVQRRAGDLKCRKCGLEFIAESFASWHLF